MIPLRDRAFSWDVSFEDEIHGDNEAAAISVISEQQDSHRLVIKAKASSGAKRQIEVKEAPVEAAVEPAPKKGKNSAAAKKKDAPTITSPTLQASKANLKTGAATAASSSTAAASGKPPLKGAAKNVPAAQKAAVAAKKIFNVASSPSTEHLDTQTLRNTLNNAKSSAEKNDFTSIKGEFGDVMPFGFGSEFDAVAGGRHSVAFDDHLNMQFKQEDDFQDLNEEFGDDFRPPRKLSWSIDFNAIEAAMGASLMNPMGDDSYSHGEGLNYGASYTFESNLDQSATQAFPSLLRATDSSSHTAVGSTATHSLPSSTMGMAHQKPGTSMSSSAASSHMTQGHYHPSGSDHHSSGMSSSMMMPNNSMTAKMSDRDQLASMMSGNAHATSHTHSVPHTNGQALAAAYAHSSAGSNPSALSSSSGALLSGDGTLTSTGTTGGLTLGGLTVPNDGEFRVGAYTKLERHLKIEAFREKKRTRIWRKQIKYDCRKRLADTRPRLVKSSFLYPWGGFLCDVFVFLCNCNAPAESREDLCRERGTREVHLKARREKADLMARERTRATLALRCREACLAWPGQRVGHSVQQCRTTTPTATSTATLTGTRIPTCTPTPTRTFTETCTATYTVMFTAMFMATHMATMRTTETWACTS